MDTMYDVGPSPFHQGERQVQLQLGVGDIEAWARKVVRPYLPAQHRQFYAKLPFLVAGARDEQGRPWATILAGQQALVSSPDDRTLHIAGKPVPRRRVGGSAARWNRFGPARHRIRHQAAQSGQWTSFRGQRGPSAFRRSNVRQLPAIHSRAGMALADDTSPGAVKLGNKLTAEQSEWIAQSDTLFIASGHRGEGEDPAFGMDASHRGGDPGFVTVTTPNRLVFPDYAGNNHYNTIGNLVVDPRVGLLFVDFESGSMLQLTGHASIEWESEAIERIPGARRLVIIDIEEIVELPNALPLRWDAEAESVRSLRLVDRVRESETVTSFYFESRDGGELAPFEAGQHLPIELHVTGSEEPVRRTYSLSGSPASDRYRLSVKRENHGTASQHLHEKLEVGAIIEARKPAGDFVLPCAHCPIVLISAGVGLTPMVSMLHVLAEEQSDRPVWFIHGARDGDHHPLKQEVADLASKRAEITVHTAYSKPRSTDRLKLDYDSEGRIDRDLLAQIDAGREAHFMMCGPVGFMAGVQQDLEALGVHADNIHSESFGPADGR